MDHSDDTQWPDGLPEQLRDLLKKANMQFGFRGAAPEQSPDTHDDEPPEDDEALERIRHFDLRPRQIRDDLDRYVISQDEAKKVLSVAICDHYNMVRRCLNDPERAERDIAKHNVLLLGPTGVGKTYLMRCAARLIGVPFVKADATKFSETGYVGYDVEDIVRDLVRIADDDLDLARYGIIYIDEIDKIAGRGSEEVKDVSGRGVQTNLLKLMEDTEVRLISQTDMLAQMQAIMAMQGGGEPPPRTIRTGHMLFIVSGAFSGLPEVIRRRLGGTRIGFGTAEADDAEGALLHRVQTADLVAYGFEPEFVGRLPVRVALDELTAANLETILAEAEDSILHQYRDDFDGYGIDLEVTPGAIRDIARLAYDEGTGARGLMTVLERLLRDFKFELPSTGVGQLTLTADMVGSPETTLADLLEEDTASERVRRADQADTFARSLGDQSGLTIRFTPQARNDLVNRSVDDGLTVQALCERLFHDFPYGLDLIARNSGKRAFRITKAAVANPADTLSRWITESYGDRDGE